MAKVKEPPGTDLFSCQILRIEYLEKEALIGLGSAMYVVVPMEQALYWS